MSVFQFKYFSVQQINSSLKVGTDSMILGASIENDSYQSILDIGTGTGVLALMAKQKNPTAKIIGIDIDEQSLIDCRENFENSPWKNDLTYRQQDFNDFTTETKFDCIICNPPYYENGLLSQSESINRAKHTVDFSLEDLLITAKSLLNENGHFWVILPYSNAEKWIEYGNSIELFPLRKRVVYGKPNLPKRMILTFGIISSYLKADSLTIRNEDNSYTKEYKELTKEFHNKSV